LSAWRLVHRINLGVNSQQISSKDEATMIRALIVLIVTGSCGVLSAEPLVHFALEGRTYGSNDPFAGIVEVAPGDTIEYRLLAVLSPPVTPYELIPKNGLGITRHGINSLYLEISQDAGDGIQVDFSSPAVLNPSEYPGFGWGAGAGAHGGILRSRPGTAFNDLIDIRPIHGPGIFTAHEWETVATGSFKVASISGASAQIRGQWTTGYDPSQGTINKARSGGIVWDGDVHFITASIESGPDPYTDGVPLTLTASNLQTVPEPSAIALLATAIACVTWCARRGSQMRANYSKSVDRASPQAVRQL
jgi:hypothetical protein